MAEVVCQYCWRPTEIDGHNPGCPIEVGTPEAMLEWKRGYQYGWNDNSIPWYRERYYSATFLYGHRVGGKALSMSRSISQPSTMLVGIIQSTKCRGRVRSILLALLLLFEPKT